MFFFFFKWREKICQQGQKQSKPVNMVKIGFKTIKTVNNGKKWLNMVKNGQKWS